MSKGKNRCKAINLRLSIKELDLIDSIRGKIGFSRSDIIAQAIKQYSSDVNNGIPCQDSEEMWANYELTRKAVEDM